MKGTIMRMIFFYMLMNWMRGRIFKFSHLENILEIYILMFFSGFIFGNQGLILMNLINLTPSWPLFLDWIFRLEVKQLGILKSNLMLIFAVSDSWGLFTQHIFTGKIIWNAVSWGITKLGSSDLKNTDLKNFRHDKDIFVENWLSPITATSKRTWFWMFFAFSRTIFWFTFKRGSPIMSPIK